MAFDATAPKTLNVTSTAYAGGQAIPAKHTCSGDDVSPPFKVAGVPPSAKTLAVILDDPDASKGTWLHWTLWNVPASKLSFAEGATASELGAREGTTSAKSVGYHGPCPPSGKPHRYFLKVYAVSATLDLQNGASLQELEQALKGKVVAWGELLGTFGR